MFNAFTALFILSHHPSNVLVHLTCKGPVLLYSSMKTSQPNKCLAFHSRYFKGELCNEACSYVSHPGKELVLVCLVSIGPICAQERCHHTAI